MDSTRKSAEARSMRTTRILAAGLACITLSSSLAFGQTGKSPRRMFEDSWYWGAKGGAALFKSASEDVTAGTAGLDWLITRRHAALYVSVEQSYFETKGVVFDPTVSGSARVVDLDDFRRYNFGLMAFPKAYGRFLPYAGLGYAILVINDVDPRGTFTSQVAMDSVFARIDQQSSRSSMVFTAGVQAQVKRYGLFLQSSTMGTRNNFLIPGAYTTYIEAGVRYNLTRGFVPLN